MIRAIASTLVLASCLFAIPPVPRKAPDFTFDLPNGQKISLSSYKGKVVLLDFVFTTCPHCQHSCSIINQLYAQYGPQGFQPLAVAWNEEAKGLVPGFVSMLGLNFPVGYTDRAGALGYLGISMMERSVVPQMIWIDRKGVIRAQTPATGDESMLTEAFYRQEITTLLAEKDTTTSVHRTAKH